MWSKELKKAVLKIKLEPFSKKEENLFLNIKMAFEEGLFGMLRLGKRTKIASCIPMRSLKKLEPYKLIYNFIYDKL